MREQIHTPEKATSVVHVGCRSGLLTLLVISLSRSNGTGGGAEAVTVCFSSLISIPSDMPVLRSCNATAEEEDGSGEVAGSEQDTVGEEDTTIDGFTIGIRRRCKEEKGDRLKSSRSFLSRGVLTVTIEELSISVVTMLD